MNTKLTLTVPSKDELYISRREESALVNDIVKSIESIEIGERFQKTRKTLGYKAAYCRETFSDELWQAMENRGLSQTAFAEKCGIPKQFLTKVFRGGNCTSDTMVKLAHGLDYTLHIHLTPNELGCGWIHCVPWSIPRASNMNTSVFFGAKYKSVSQIEKEMDYATVTIDS